MTNEQIITELAIQLFGEENVMDMISEGTEPPLHTFQGWAARGYKVKKGEHAVAVTKLWKKKKDNNKDSSEEESEKQDDSIPTNRDFYMCRAFLFRGEQVERAEVTK
jgi:hypothetical protein